MANYKLLPLLALVGGAVGLVLRRVELATAYDEFGLPVGGAPATLALTALTLVVAMAVLVLGRGTQDFSGRFGDAFRTESSGVMTAMVAAAFLLGAAGGVELWTAYPTLGEGAYRYLAAGQGGLRMALGRMFGALPAVLVTALSLAGMVAILITAKGSYRGSKTGGRSVATLLPGYAACLWLIRLYQERAGDPVLMNYIYQLLAMVCLVVALYLMAGLAFDCASTRLVVFTCLMGTYCAVVSLGSLPRLSLLLLNTFAALYLSLSAAVLLYNDARPNQSVKEEDN